MVSKVVKDEAQFKAWFSRSSVFRSTEGKIQLKVSSVLAKGFIEKHFYKLLSQSVKKEWGASLEIVLSSEDGMQETDRVEQGSAQEKQALAPTCEASRSSNDRSREKFDAFVTGPENLLAYTAAQGVATGSAHVHTPLFIMGRHGMGKTHLVSSIQSSFSSSQVLCWHAEEFANSYIQSLQSNELDRFRALIRSKKVLIIEDIDFFLEGEKRKTKDELLHSLKVLKREHRHIVITSSEPVSRFSQSAPRLANFLMGGLAVRLDDMTPNTRKKMVDHYLKSFDCSLSLKGKTFLSEIDFRTPQELKGAIQQIAAYSVLKNESLPLSVLKDILSDFLHHCGGQDRSSDNQDLHSIAKGVCHAYGVNLQKLCSPSRERYVSLARHVAMSLSHEFHFTLKEIGQFYGGRLHQSVLHGVKRIGAKKEKDLDFRRAYHKLLQELRSSLIK